MNSTSARNLLRRHYDSYGGYSMMMMMTDDDHQQQDTTPRRNQENQEKEEEQELAGTSSSSRRAADDTWLQLGIGPSSATPAISPSVELELFSDKPPSSSRPTLLSSSTPLPLQQLNIGYDRPVSPWGFTTNYLMNMQQVGGTNTSIGASTSMLNMPQLFNYNVQRFSILPPPPPPPPLRAVRMPARSGVWFVLKAADNQVREPFLPQIPKSYLRIKDGRMTVRLLMKYLVNKLGLIDESEITIDGWIGEIYGGRVLWIVLDEKFCQVQISCRGQVLPPFLTLQHVRDSIWCLSDAVAFHPNSPGIDHVMTLQYSRSL